MAMSKEEGVEILERAQKELAKAKTKEEAIIVLQSAGQAVGYKPAFRCLIAGTEPSKSIKWGS